MATRGMKGWIVGAAAVLAILIGLGFLAGLFGGLVHEWRAGTAFFRHRDGEGHLASHADVLILLALIPLALIVGQLWSWWDRRRDARLVADIRKRRQKESPASDE